METYSLLGLVSYAMNLSTEGPITVVSKQGHVTKVVCSCFLKNSPFLKCNDKGQIVKCEIHFKQLT